MRSTNHKHFGNRWRYNCYNNSQHIRHNLYPGKKIKRTDTAPQQFKIDSEKRITQLDHYANFIRLFVLKLYAHDLYKRPDTK